MLRGKVWTILRRDRDISRQKNDGRLENSPDYYQEKGLATKLATDIPAIVLLKQNGTAAGWSGTPFYSSTSKDAKCCFRQSFVFRLTNWFIEKEHYII
jgi:hypothetical protein